MKNKTYLEEWRNVFGKLKLFAVIRQQVLLGLLSCLLML